MSLEPLAAARREYEHCSVNPMAKRPPVIDP